MPSRGQEIVENVHSRNTSNPATSKTLMERLVGGDLRVMHRGWYYIHLHLRVVIHLVIPKRCVDRFKHPIESPCVDQPTQPGNLGNCTVEGPILVV